MIDRSDYTKIKNKVDMIQKIYIRQEVSINTIVIIVFTESPCMG